jgi:hypothetical protein
MNTHTSNLKILYLSCYFVVTFCSLLCNSAHAREKSKEQTLFGMSIEPKRTVKYDGARWSYEARVALPASYRTSNKSYPVLWVTV